MKPQSKYCCAQLFAGAVLINESKKHGIIINCAEAYGRTRTVDAHRECFVNKKGRPAPSSLRPPRTLYNNVWPTTIEDGEGAKLVIGTKSCNILVSSSLQCTSQCRRINYIFSPDGPQEFTDYAHFFDQDSVRAGKEPGGKCTK